MCHLHTEEDTDHDHDHVQTDREPVLIGDMLSESTEDHDVVPFLNVLLELFFFH
jgi:hypothetical protein